MNSKLDRHKVEAALKQAAKESVNGPKAARTGQFHSGSGTSSVLKEADKKIPPKKHK